MLSNEELYNIKGGALNITGSLISNILAVANKLFELGRTVGSAVRRLHDRNYCSL